MTARDQEPVARRVPWIDAIRILLTALVVMVHASVTCGGEGSWYVKEPGATTAERIALTFFNATCQSFFMGLFFYLAGRFAPGSRDRKGTAAFLRDRFLRLGIPILAYDLLLNPLTIYIRESDRLSERGPGQLWLDYLRGKDNLGDGPVWFLTALLVFTFAWLAVRWLGGPRPLHSPAVPAFPRWRAIVLFALLLGLVTFAVRLAFPVGSVFEPLNFQIPFFPQYIALFALGIASHRLRWLEDLTDRVGRRWLAATAAALVAMPVLLVAGGGASGDFGPFLGGPTGQALGYAVWEQLACVSISIGLLWLFRTVLANRAGPLLRECAAGAYTVYIIHPPVLVFLTVASRPVDVPAIVRFAGLSAATLLACFGLAAGIRRLPGARSIL